MSDGSMEGGFAFREGGAWTVEPDACAWLAGTDDLRAAQRAELPVLLRPRALPPVGRFLQAAAAVGAATLLWWLGARRRGDEASRRDLSHRLRLAFERLGPTYIKLGQILSAGTGLFPVELVAEFKRCRDQVPAEPFDRVRAVVEEELGRPLEQVFARFDRTPVAAASIAQVHAAVLTTGERVVVKVQRPGVSELVRRDIEAMAWIAPRLVGRLPVAALANPPALVELFAETITEELDFRLEAENMLDVARVLCEAGQRAVIVPRPHPDLVTRRVLVMEQIEGFGYEDVDGMRGAGVDPTAVLRGLLISFLEGAMLFGVFHGDLHGGNLLVLADGRVALLDYGITGRMNAAQRVAFLRMMMTGAANDLRGQLAAFRDLGALPPDADLEKLATLLRIDQPTLDPTTLSGEQLVAEIQQILKGLLAQGAKLPKHLMLYAKNLLFIDDAIATWAPNVDLFQELIRIYTYLATHHGERVASDTGFDPRTIAPDLDGIRRQLGLPNEVESLTHQELQERRREVQEKFEKAGGLPTKLGS